MSASQGLPLGAPRDQAHTARARKGRGVPFYRMRHAPHAVTPRKGRGNPALELALPPLGLTVAAAPLAAGPVAATARAVALVIGTHGRLELGHLLGVEHDL